MKDLNDGERGNERSKLGMIKGNNGKVQISRMKEDLVDMKSIRWLGNIVIRV